MHACIHITSITLLNNLTVTFFRNSCGWSSEPPRNKVIQFGVIMRDMVLSAIACCLTALVTYETWSFPKLHVHERGTSRGTHEQSVYQQQQQNRVFMHGCIEDHGGSYRLCLWKWQRRKKITNSLKTNMDEIVELIALVSTRIWYPFKPTHILKFSTSRQSTKK